MNIFEKRFGKKANRGLAVLLAIACVISLISVDGLGMRVAAQENVGVISTVDDPETLTRPVTTYGNSTLNAGKILVGKSVTDGKNDTTGAVEKLDLSSELYNMEELSEEEKKFSPDENNFLVTISQSSQMYGISSEIPIPMDVVFVLDVSNSMDQNNRTKPMVTAANNAIKTILDMNDLNRISVVAFSSKASSSSSSAATLLSSLSHYNDAGNNNAASEHITHSNDRLYGRNTNGNSGTYRTVDGGTNIQAGILLGAEQLMNASDLVVTVGEGSLARQVTRIPVMVVLSDGAPTFSVSHNEWWNVDYIDQEQGPGGSYYAGNGFKAALAAAYYKEEISEHYYGEGNKNSTLIYTIGVGVGTNSNADLLAQITLDPSGKWNAFQNGFATSFRNYWTSYTRTNNGYNNYFTVSVNNGQDYRFNYKTYTEGNYNNRVTYNDNILYPQPASLAYNDDYFAASDGKIENAFEDMVIEIQKRAITAPTITDSQWGEDYSGYVTFTDPIGEYMEVKDVVGVTGEGYLYQGKRLSKLAEGYDPEWNNADYDWANDWYHPTSDVTQEEQMMFNEQIEQAMLDRINSTAGGTTSYIQIEQVKQILDVVTRRQAEGNLTVQINDQVTRTFDYATYGGQLEYTSDTDYSNSICWFGKQEIPAGEEDAIVKFIGVAPKNADSIEWLTSSDKTDQETLAAAKQAGANCVVRSYYMYGTADDEAEYEVNDMLHFQLFVIREIEGPVYQQYVHIKAPASLLAMQKVLIDDTDPDNLEAHYDELIPSRVIYEVGLREDITPDNVWTKIDSNYAAEYGNINEDGSFHFYTNDYTRYQSAQDVETIHDHTHALTSATFDAAANNSFYCYEEDTLLVDAGGNPVAVSSNGGQYYYNRVYYTWTLENPDIGIAEAIKSSKLIPVTITASDVTNGVVIQKNGNWYVKAGNYTAHNLADGDGVTSADVIKRVNETATAQRVVHPERTEDSSNSHYTVWLGNNGMLTFMPNKPKTVHTVTDDGNSIGVGVINIDGETVVVGSTLEYQIEATNYFDTVADIVITDKIPEGTTLIAGSINNGGVYDSATNTITWNLDDIAVDEKVVVTFQVVVNEDAIEEIALTNQADIKVGNNEYSTNITKNPVTGKQAVDPDGSALPEEGVAVGELIEYRIAWVNNTDKEAIITITDIVPDGTTLVNGSITHGGNYDSATNTITWILGTANQKIQPGINGVVSFEVKVTADVPQNTADNSFTVKNDAKYTFDHDPNTVIETNDTETKVNTGNIKVSKNILPARTYHAGDTIPSFTLTLTESTGSLNGTFKTDVNSTVDAGTVTFNMDGKATLTIQDQDTVVIKGLPEGITIYVTEENPGAGFTASYAPANGAVLVDTAAVAEVTVTNNYKAAPTSLVIGGTKKLQNNDVFDQTKQFTFELKSTDANYTTVAVNADLVHTISVSAGANSEGSNTFNFAALKYETVGTYYYLLTEVNNGLNGVSYDSTNYKLEVVVSDNGAGRLVTEVYVKDNTAVNGKRLLSKNSADETKLDFSQLVFSNAFAPKLTTVKFQGTKTLTNGVLSDRQFSFVIKEVGINNGQLTFTNKVYGQNTAGSSADVTTGSINFTEFTYTSAGTYVYEISEIAGQNINNITYDNTKYYVKVVVSETNGQLEVSEVATAEEISLVNNEIVGGTSGWTIVTNDSDNPLKSTAYIHFRNEYNPGYTYVTLGGNKKLTGRNMEAGEFAFIVTEPAQNGKVVAEVKNGVAENQVVNSFTFPQIGYTLADLDQDVATGNYSKTFSYLISEVKGFDSNITYSESTYTAEVTVSYAAAGGWSTSVIYKKDNQVIANNEVLFENIFTPNPAVVKLEIGNKFTENAATIQNVTFGYTVVKVSAQLNGQDIETNVAAGSVVATGISGTSGKIALSDLTFYEPGTYIMDLYENNGGTIVHGVTYGKERYRITVVVTQNSGSGELSASVSYQELKLQEGTTNQYVVSGNDIAEGEVAFNNKYEAEGSLKITAKKVVKGKQTEAGAYNFTLTEVDSNGNSLSNVHVGTNDENGLITFDTLLFDQNDIGATLYYVMEEVAGSDGNMVYDQTRYRVTVNVGQATDGKLHPTYKVEKYVNSEEVTEAVFTNKGIYHGTSAQINLVKELTGRDIADGEFRFVVTHTGTKKWNGNEYVDEAGATIYGVVNSAATSAAQVDPVTGNAIDSLTITVPISNAGFKPGEKRQYVYTVEEINNGLNGVTYDPNKYTVTITDVQDQDEDGHLDPVTTANISITGDNVNSTLDRITFNNTYKASSVDVNIHGYKTLKDNVTGELMAIPSDVFDFEVYLINNGTEILQETGSNEAGVAGEGANIPFTTFTFDTAGEYIYKVVEAIGTQLSYINYSNDEWYIKVIVTDNTVTGQLEASVSIADAVDGTFVEYNPAKVGKESQIQFVNIYDASDAVVALQATKTLIGRDMRRGEFTFEAYKAEVVSNKLVKVANTSRVAVGSNGAPDNQNKAIIELSQITYNQAGTYYYIMDEVVHDDSAHVQNTTGQSIFAKVVIEDRNGVLEAKSVEYIDEDRNPLSNNEAAFTNTYTPDPLIGTEIYAQKNLTGGKNLNAGDFTFTLTQIPNNESPSLIAAGTYEVTASNNDSGLVEFTLPDIKEKGKYEFTLTEVSGGDISTPMKYDGAEYKVTVEVADDGNGNLSANVAYAVKDQNGSYVDITTPVPEFNNVYVPEEIPVEFSSLLKQDGAKKLIGRDMNDDDIFSFEVKDVLGNVVATGTNNKNGEITFIYKDEDGNPIPGIMFSQIGIYRYTVTEVEGSQAGITYDPAVWTVQVTIVQDASTGKLVVKDEDGLIIYSVSNSTADPAGKIVFNNKYDAMDAEVILKGDKILTGNRSTSSIKENEFQFRLIEVDGEGRPIVVAANGTTLAGGEIVFDKLTFTEPTEKNYQLVEVAGSASGIRYNIDRRQYNVNIKVVDDPVQAKLIPTVTVNGAAYTEDAIRFINYYYGLPVAAEIAVTKTMEGKALNEVDPFEFALEKISGPALHRIDNSKNDADGKVVFNVDFSVVGTYEFKLSEVRGTDYNIVYDNEAVFVTVKVTDPGHGHLKADVTYKNANGEPLGNPGFVNKWSPAPTMEQITVNASKKLEGKNLTDNEFSFVIKDESGRELATGINDKSGKINFTEFGIPEGNDQKLYISEVNKGVTGITYDATIFVLTVDVVRDQVTGELDAIVEYPADGVVFKNKYTEPVSDPEPDPEQDPEPNPTPAPIVSPGTGDNNDYIAFIIMMFIGVLGLTGASLWKYIYGRKSDKMK